MSGTTFSAAGICRELDRLATSGKGLDELLTRAVDLLHEAHPRFHWTGIYELFPDETLRLGGGVLEERFEEHGDLDQRTED